MCLLPHCSHIPRVRTHSCSLYLEHFTFLLALAESTLPTLTSKLESRFPQQSLPPQEQQLAQFPHQYSNIAPSVRYENGFDCVFSLQIHPPPWTGLLSGVSTRFPVPLVVFIPINSSGRGASIVIHTGLFGWFSSGHYSCYTYRVGR